MDDFEIKRVNHKKKEKNSVKLSQIIKNLVDDSDELQIVLVR